MLSFQQPNKEGRQMQFKEKRELIKRGRDEDDTYTLRA